MEYLLLALLAVLAIAAVHGVTRSVVFAIDYLERPGRERERQETLAREQAVARLDKSLPDNVYRIRMGEDPFVPVALASEHWARLADFIRAGDMIGLRELAGEGKAGLMEPETLLRLIGPKAGTTAVEVRIESGPNAGKLVYLVREALSRDLSLGQENGPNGHVMDVDPMISRFE